MFSGDKENCDHSRRQFVAHSIAAAAGMATACSPLAFLRASELDEYGRHDALGLAELVKRRDVTPLELLNNAIASVESLNPKLNAIVTKMYDEAKASIRRGLPDGPFRGVPFLLKDIGAQYAGVRYTAGSRILKDFVASSDSEIVKRYKQAGLVIFGRTNTPEFGLNVTTESELLGPARNPWNLEHSTGGSSGGAAAAVSARIVPIAHGGDGGGSIRIPSSCCGVFGMKPSRGRMPMGPASGEVWEGFVTLGTLSLSVRDNAAMLDATSAPEIGAPYGIPAPERPFLQDVLHDPRPLRIAWTTNGGAEGVHPDCVAATKDAARRCEDLGHRLEEAAPNIDYEELKSAFFMVLEAHTAAFLDGMIDIAGKRATPDNVEPWTWRVAERGRKSSAADFARNKAKLNRATRTLGTFFEKYDVLLTPTLGSPPRKLGSFNTFDLSYDELRQRIFDFCPYTWIHNVAGTPAISVPLHWNKEGLPVGVQFAAKLAGESTLYGLAGQLERARPWKDRRPPL